MHKLQLDYLVGLTYDVATMGNRRQRQERSNRFDEFYHITAEMEALKNRVRRLIGNRHFPTDGEWKESIVRTMIRRYLSSSHTIARGFIVTSEATTSQIDVMLVKPNSPCLHQDGDLLCVTPDSVSAIAEVKTGLTRRGLEKALTTLEKNNEVVRSQPNGFHCLSGLIVLEQRQISPRVVKEILYALERISHRSQVDLISIGPNIFVKYWDYYPDSQSGNNREYRKWHIYNLENAAPAYFLMNMVEAACQESISLYSDIWYPEGGKAEELIDIVAAHEIDTT